MPTPQPAIAPENGHYEFGPFRFDPARRSLHRNNEFVALTPKAAEILALLLEEAGLVVTKEQIFERAWPGVVVEEGAIANNISALRKTLDPAFGGEGAIATVPRRGYRLTVPVRRGGEAPPAPRAPAQEAIAAPAAPARRTITERETILIGEIENTTGDSVFDGTLRQALALHLAQSPSIEVLADRKVLSLLQIMKRPDAPLMGEVALEICQRAGAKAAITGTIFVLGNEYVIGLQALNGDNGDILVTEQARAHGKEEVLAALDRAALGLRTKLGESLASVTHYCRPFDEIGTSSLEALKAYAMGRMQWYFHGEMAAKSYQLRAIELDPNFVSAYSAIALACFNMGQTLEGKAYMQKAFELRDRATERERVRIEAGYHTMVSGDLFRGIDAHRTWEQVYPKDVTASINLTNIYMLVGQWDKAVAAALRAYGREQDMIAVSNLAISLFAAGRHKEACAAIDSAFARGQDAFVLHLDAYHGAYLRGDEKAMQAHVDAVRGRVAEEDFLIAAQADTEACHGRFGRARELSRRAVESARRADSLEVAALWEAEAALREAEIGVHDLARAGGAAALELGPETGRVVHGMATLALARGGNTRRAQELIEALAESCPQDTLINRYWLPCARAALAMGAKDWKGALDALDESTGVELGQTQPLEGGLMYPPYLRGLALLEAGRGEEAAREFRKIVDRPGLIKNFVIHPLAIRGLAKSLAMAGHAKESAAMQARFREMWAGADAELAHF